MNRADEENEKKYGRCAEQLSECVLMRNGGRWREAEFHFACKVFSCCVTPAICLVLLPLQEAVRYCVGAALPAAVRPGHLLPLPSLHRRLLRWRQVGGGRLRPAEEGLPQHHGEPPPTPAAPPLNALLCLWLILLWLLRLLHRHVLNQIASIEKECDRFKGHSRFQGHLAPVGAFLNNNLTK